MSNKHDCEIKATLRDFREGIRKGKFTARDIAEATRIPLQTVYDMNDLDWGDRMFTQMGRVKKIGRAIEKLRV